MKIAYVSSYDARNIRSWSGTPYHMSKFLDSEATPVEYICPLQVDILSKLNLISKKVFYKYVRHQHYLGDWNIPTLKNYAKQISDKLSSSKPDIVLSPVTYTLAYLECQQPMAFWADATFAGLVNYYPWHSNLSEESIKLGNLLEQRVLDKCKVAIYSSEWAANTAKKNYKVNPDKIKVVPYGGNFECNNTLEDIKSMVSSKSQKSCKLLFLGVNWERKGGDIAFAVAKALNEAGLKTELTIVGCQPVLEQPYPDFVKPLGFISKSTESGKKQIEQLLSESHFLILPSRADCTPIVLSEANSFGVPCLTSVAGGISTIIKNDLNGKTFKEQFVTECCNYVLSLFSNYSQYQNLALSSFEEYQNRLNWSVATATVKKILQE